MPNGVFNWTFRDVAGFLRSHHFSLSHVEGSHYYYQVFTGGAPRIVHVPFHGSKALKPRTLNSIIRESGIPRQEWLS